MFHKVSAVRPRDGLHLLVWFDTGEVMSYDVNPLLQKWQVFEALRDESLFCQVKVDAGGYGISWNDDIDLAGNELFENGVPADPWSSKREEILYAIVELRKEEGISQAQLGKAASLQQPVIARLEKGETSPRLDTILKVLAPLGKTLAIVDL